MNKCKKKMDKKFKVIDDKSRPGYTLYESLVSGKRYWARRPKPHEFDNCEEGTFTYEQGLALGLYKGMKHKKFSELTDEEQKLFNNDDYYQKSKDIR